MQEFNYKDHKITIYTDPMDFFKEFCEPLPEGAEIVSAPSSAGMSNIQDKEIWIYAGEACEFHELLGLVAHEMGHIVTGGFVENPPETDGYDVMHEIKAHHYEQFAIDAYRVASFIYEWLEEQENEA